MNKKFKFTRIYSKNLRKNINWRTPSLNELTLRKTESKGLQGIVF